jgi:hypothetical protein
MSFQEDCSFQKDKNELQTSFNNKTIRSYLNCDIKHLEQKTKNDCGIACLKMAIDYVHKNGKLIVSEEIGSPQKNVDHLLKELKISDLSLWTIDLAHVCSLMNIKHQMYTITYGVDDNYSSEHFYSADKSFDVEKQRISEKFDKASDLGICVVKKSITLDFIKNKINQNCVCIVLVNAAVLNGINVNLTDDNLLVLNDDLYSKCLKKNSTNNKETCCLFNPFCCSSNKSNYDDFASMQSSLEVSSDKINYLGHFIVLIGYDDDKRLIFYRNPASNRTFSLTSYLNFEAARKSYGTDQDIFFVYI